MKRRLGSMTLLTLCNLVPLAQAQVPPDQIDMQRMMQGMQEMQRCLGGIDQSALERLERDAERLEQRVRSLCSAGSRDQAQREAMRGAATLMQDPTVQAVKACSEPLPEMMPAFAFSELPGAEQDRHVCDEY